MDTSQKVDEIMPALFAAKANFSDVVKRSKNEHFKTSYANLQAVLDAVEQPLTDQGILLLQPTMLTEDASGTPLGRMHVETLLYHVPSGQSVSCTWELNPAKRDPQGEGSALTYGRRYTLMSLLGLTAEDDDGHNASTAASNQRREEERQREAERVRAAEAAKRDWLAELAACTTDQQVVDLGREADQVGQFAPNRAEFMARREALKAPTVEPSATAPADGTESGASA